MVELDELIDLCSTAHTVAVAARTKTDLALGRCCGLGGRSQVGEGRGRGAILDLEIAALWAACLDF